MNLQSIMDDNTLLVVSLKYKPRKNTCIVCGICETCELYVTDNSHNCLNRRPEKNGYVYKKFNAEEKDNFTKFVELNIFWKVEADFDEDFYYCLCNHCYQDAIGKKHEK